MQVKTWVADEISFHSTKIYKNPFEDVDIDVFFRKGKLKLRIPAFWNGENIWVVRFSLPEEGTWTYDAKCTDLLNEGLNQKGKIECVKYSGNIEIYKRGFVKTELGKRYFVYNDGTPFFYLGDTHWNFFEEEFDAPGEHANSLNFKSHFKDLVDIRCKQGFTVYQSEPIGAKYNLSSGLNSKDIEVFKEIDKRFKYIAKKGLVHANAQICFPKNLTEFSRLNDLKYLKRLGRYWAARYSAYPVLWTLGQEVDNDFYFNRGDQKVFTKENNPYKIIAEGLHENDAYSHPLTAHMEISPFSKAPLNEGTSCSNSAFRKLKGHDWWAFQWNRNLSRPINYDFAKDGWLNGQEKVCILYESYYDHLWTKNKGARTEGWLAFLNGLYGYGYGAIDIWLYKSNFDTNTTSFDGIEKITPKDKAIFWSESVTFETTKQLGYMKKFLQDLKWWRLIPRFDSPLFFVSDKENFHAIATDERDIIVIYFCNFDSDSTGELQNLDFCEYFYQWFNPRNGKFLEKNTFYPDKLRKFHVGPKPDSQDWVLLVSKTNY